MTIIALAILTLGFASCSKDDSVKPVKPIKTVVADKTDVGQGD